MGLDITLSAKPWYEKLPPLTEKINDENLEMFFRMMYERQEIWYRTRLLKEKYVSKDEILRDNKFTNVYRELDRSSQFLISQIIMDESLDKRDLVWKIMLYKIFNSPETFQKVQIPSYRDYDKDDFKNEIDHYQKVYGNAFTTAYMINTTICKGDRRHLCYCNIHIPHLHKSIDSVISRIGISQKVGDVNILIKHLKTLHSVSDFMAHEFYQDFTYVERYSDMDLINWDQNDYTNVGPGASLGLRLIFPSSQTIQLQESRLRYLREISVEMFRTLKLDFKYLYWDKVAKEYFTSPEGELSLHQIEMSLCEFQKYWKMQIGEGKQRSKYKFDGKKDYSFYLY